MQPQWSIDTNYTEWVNSLLVQSEPETCMAYSICNAAKMSGRKIKPSYLLDLWERWSLCVPGFAPVIRPNQALKVAKSYFREAGMECKIREGFSSSEFAKTFNHEPVKELDSSYIITLGPAYMRKFHETIGERIPKRARNESFQGPGHDVLVLGLEGTNVVVHDPDPQLKNEKRDARFDGAPVVVLTQAEAQNYYAMGDYAKHLTIVSKLIKPPTKGKRKREKGEAPLFREDT